jgi:hypothetical protein
MTAFVEPEMKCETKPRSTPNCEPSRGKTIKMPRRINNSKRSSRGKWNCQYFWKQTYRKPDAIKGSNPFDVKMGARLRSVRANVICPGFVRTPLVEKQIPEQAKELGISEQEVIKNVMLKETVDGEFTTVDDVAETALFLASFGSNALTGQSIVVSHGWFMQ